MDRGADNKPSYILCAKKAVVAGGLYFPNVAVSRHLLGARVPDCCSSGKLLARFSYMRGPILLSERGCPKRSSFVPFTRPILARGLPGLPMGRRKVLVTSETVNIWTLRMLVDV